MHTVGVQRQYSGTAGKIENCQLAVHLSYASPAGHTLVDVALYLPRSWADDPSRRAEAGVPDSVGFATKPQLARRLIDTSLAGGLPCRWVAGDEAYGGDPHLAKALRGHDQGHVLTVACSHRVPTGLGIHRADQIAAGLPTQAWQRISAGQGAKGHRYHDWAFVTLPLAVDEHQGHHWLLIRRNHTTGELAFYRCWSPQPVPLRHLVTVAGRWWSIEESFQTAKTGLGLDQHQHRRWRTWHRWTTLVIAAHAFLAAAAAAAAANTTTDDLIPITVNELRRLFHALIIEPTRHVGDVIAWSIFRRQHQAAAKTSHYTRQASPNPETDLLLEY